MKLRVFMEWLVVLGIMTVIASPLFAFFGWVAYVDYDKQQSGVEKEAIVLKETYSHCMARTGCRYRFLVEIDGIQTEYDSVNPLPLNKPIRVIIQPDGSSSYITVGTKDDAFLKYHWENTWKKHVFVSALLLLIYWPIRSFLSRKKKKSFRLFK
jgi:hypothetical protein